MLFCRETSCMSGRPCRAHHKLKWARKVQSIVMLLYEHLSLSESDKDSTQFAHGLSKGARQPYQRLYRKTAPQKWIAQSNVTQCRNRPLARSARRYKGVIGESKEGIGGTRNPPCPPWPPEAPKIKGKIIDNHLRKPNARKNRKIDPRRIQERNERTLKEPPRKNILSPTLHVPPSAFAPPKPKNARTIYIKEVRA